MILGVECQCGPWGAHTVERHRAWHAIITFAIVIGEFTMAALLNRPAFGPYLQLVGANKAYEPSALAIIAFAITWLSMGLIQLVSRFGKLTQSRP